MPENNAEHDHVEYQRRYFDSHCDIFSQPIPEDIDQRTASIVKAANLKRAGHILDVGTGMGVLIKHFVEQGIPESCVIGCDLSSAMLATAKQRYPQATFWQGDFKDFPTTFQKFEAVFFNACFGNLYDQNFVIARALSLLKPGGAIIISHPLGNRFVAQLKEQDPQLVLALLPDRQQLNRFAELGLAVETFIDEPDFYLAVLRRPAITSESAAD